MAKIKTFRHKPGRPPESLTEAQARRFRAWVDDTLGEMGIGYKSLAPEGDQWVRDAMRKKGDRAKTLTPTTALRMASRLIVQIGRSNLADKRRRARDAAAFAWVEFGLGKYVGVPNDGTDHGVLAAEACEVLRPFLRGGSLSNATLKLTRFFRKSGVECPTKICLMNRRRHLKTYGPLLKANATLGFARASDAVVPVNGK